MIIRYLYPLCAAILPDEADAPLLIDPDAVLPEAIPFQRLQTISRRYREVAQFSRRMDLQSDRNAGRKCQA